MSASTEKKLRAAAREEGNDKKAAKAAEEAKKAAVTKRRFIIGAVVVVLAIALVLFFNSNFLYKNTTALTIGDNSYSPADVNYAYATAYNNFAQTYGDYASMFGFDTSYGLAGLSTQNCPLMDNSTWRDYFLETAVANLKQTAALCKYAGDNGITLTEDEDSSLTENMNSLEEYVKAYGYSSLKKYLAANYGKGVDKEVAIKHERANLIASKAYSQICEEAAAGDTEFKDYSTKSFRHILVNAEASEDGTYSEEAKLAAKAACEDILAEWEAGEKTEDSFAELVALYTDDTASAETGGLYADSVKGQMVSEIDSFIYDSSRKPGDTAICYSGDDAGYCGYHVVYFVGDGVKYSETSSRASELDALASPVVTELADALPVTYGSTYKLVGKN